MGRLRIGGGIATLLKCALIYTWGFVHVAHAAAAPAGRQITAETLEGYNPRTCPLVGVDRFVMVGRRMYIYPYAALCCAVVCHQALLVGVDRFVMLRKRMYISLR